MSLEKVKCHVIPENRISCCDGKECKQYTTLRTYGVDFHQEGNKLKGVPDTLNIHECKVTGKEEITCMLVKNNRPIRSTAMKGSVLTMPGFWEDPDWD